MKKGILVCLGWLILFSETYAQKGAVLDYANENLSVEQRVNDLVAKLTLPQKIKLLQYRSTAIDSNGVKVPAYNWWNECLHGVARAGKATVFPQAIGLAATWDTALIFKVADAISDEARAKFNYFSSKGQRGIYQGLNFWTPNINIFRDPRWGRGMETYGEDPFLTGKIAASFVRGLQGNNPNYFKSIATIKHFVVHSGPESSRHRFNANVSDYDFYNTYTPAFKRVVEEAGVYSLMCAYNRFRDKPCCGSDFLLTDLLRKQWGFKGFIVTDCGAVDDFYKKGTHQVVATAEEASAMAIKAGVDLECGDIFNALDKAIQKKLITEAELDVALKRLFTARFKLGLFDDKSKLPYNQIPYSVVESAANQKLALEAAKKSIVLLKNEKNALPMSKNLKTLAIIGPNADDEETILANYHGFSSHIITPLKGITQKLPHAKILYAKGCAHADGLPTYEIIPASFLFADAGQKSKGLKATYYGNQEFKGEPVLKRIDTQVHFNWIEKLPLDNIDPLGFSVVWEGFIAAPTSGKYTFDVFGSNDAELYLNNKKLLELHNSHEPSHSYASIELKKGELQPIKIKYINRGNNRVVNLNWQRPDWNLFEEALAVAKKADAVVLCMGLSPRIEGEEMKIKLDGFDGGDRVKLALPQVQQNLIKNIAALGKPVVLVLLNGSAVAINWEKDNLPAILESFYGGQAAGAAIADVLFGDYNPSGKLPLTFYHSESDLPAFEDYNMQGRTYRYFTGKPLFPFGFGLSYTKFAYSNIAIHKKQVGNNSVYAVEANIKNIGNLDGEEVAQLYIKSKENNTPAYNCSLKSFQRIALNKGETKKLVFNLNETDFYEQLANGQWNDSNRQFEVFVGGGQPGLESVSKEISLGK